METLTAELPEWVCKAQELVAPQCSIVQWDVWQHTQLQTVRYKPGVELSVICDVLIVKVQVPDTYHPSNTVGVQLQVDIPSHYAQRNDVEGFRTWLLKQLITLEIHETMEWFRVNDAIHFNPHKVASPSLEQWDPVPLP